MTESVVRVVSSLAEIERSDWDAVANPGWPSDRPLEPLLAGMPRCDARPPYDPFLAHDFLEALERAGCAVPKTGWHGRHLVIDDAAGRPQAILPAYLKTHSHGEYVFDWGWADAYERAGGRYYPKLQVAVPFTPVTGRRLLVRADADHNRMRALLAAATVTLCERVGASSVHITFLTPDEAAFLAGHGWLARTDSQFHWTNEGYGSYDDFLSSLASRKRKQLKRERREAVADGITIEWRTGSDITEADWDAFFAFYMDTGSRKWGRPYLNRRFFSLLGERMADRVLLVMARRAGKAIAGALNLIGSDAIYGRYWGCTEEHPFLHFEVCYHQAIEWAIAHKWPRVEAGAQGPHKLARGYLPVTTHSAHYIADRRLAGPVARYLEEERAAVAAQAAMMRDMGPFRRG